jgi:hypothetical protein
MEPWCEHKNIPVILLKDVPVNVSPFIELVNINPVGGYPVRYQVVTGIAAASLVAPAL